MSRAPDILCIGSVLWDIIGRCPQPMPAGADRPGRIARRPGGVAMNIATVLARLGLRPALLTAIGRDPEGADLMSACAALGLDVAHVHRADDLPTDRYMAVEAAGVLVAAIADAHSLEAAGAAILAPLADGRLGSAAAPWAGPVALDGNLTASLLADIAVSPLFAAADLRVAPASPGKADRLSVLVGHPRATLYVNLEEAGLLAGGLPAGADAATAAEALLARGAARVLVTDGAALAADGKAGDGIVAARPPAVTAVQVTGAGDTFMAAHLVAERAGADRATALARGLAAAAAHVASAPA